MSVGNDKGIDLTVLVSVSHLQPFHKAGRISVRFMGIKSFRMFTAA